MTNISQFVRRKYQREYEQLPSSRRVIQYGVDLYFRDHVHVDERAFQALELCCTRCSDSRNAVLWRNALLLEPAIAALIEQIVEPEFPYADFAKYLAQYQTVLFSAERGYKYIKKTLRACFRDNNYKTTSVLNDYGKKIQKASSLSLVDLLAGPLAGRCTTSQIPPMHFALKSGIKSFSSSVDWITWTDSFTKRLWNSFHSIRRIDPSVGEQQFIMILDGSEIRVLPSGTWGYCLPEHGDILRPGTIPLRGNIIQSFDFFTHGSLSRLEYLINSQAKESEFQTFFTDYPEYLQALGPYCRVYPHVVLQEESDRTQVPDFFLENVDTGFCDICDLKQPAQDLVKEKAGRTQFRDCVMSGIRQLSDYRNFFEDRANRRDFTSRYPQLKAFRPRVILIIGRSQHFLDGYQRELLQSELPGWVTIKTYDDVVAAARRWRGLWGS